MKKIITVILSVLLCCSVFAGCSPTEEIDTTKTQLYIFRMTGGDGEPYIKNAATKFEEKYKDYSFEEGKKGVQVILDQRYVFGKTLLQEMENSKNEILISEGFSLSDFPKYCYDVTEWIKEPLTEFGEDKSILDMLLPDSQPIRNFNGKYYSLPMFISGYNIVIDVDLMERKGLWILDGSTDSILNLGKSEGNTLSKGGDNLAGTFDDGFPDTWAQFYTWCDKMASSEKNVIPMNLSGKYQMGVDYVLQSFCADMEGKDQYNLNFSFKGTANTIIDSIDDNGNPIMAGPVLIENDPANGKYPTTGNQLVKQKSRYESIKIMKKFAEKKSSWFTKESFYDDQDNLMAQNKFLYSVYDTPVLMHFDGSWFESEADPIFKDMAEDGYGKNDRKLQMLPMPKADRTRVGDKRTVALSSGSSSMLVNKNLADNKKEIVKKFYQFMHSNEILVDTMSLTGMVRPFKLENFTEKDKDKLSHWERTTYELVTDAEVDIVNGADNNLFFLANQDNMWKFFFTATLNNNKDTQAFMKHFVNNPSATPKTVFDAMANAFDDNTWSSYINKIK